MIHGVGKEMRASTHSPKTSERTAGMLCAEEGQRALCQDAYGICESQALHDDGKLSDAHEIEALPLWPSLQKVSFS